MRHPSTRRGLVDGRAGAIPVLLVAIALVAGCASPGPSSSVTGSQTPPEPPASTGSSSAAPGETPGATPGGSPGVTTLPSEPPTSPTTGWTKLDVPASPAIARLVATRAGETTHSRPWRVVGQRVDFCVSPNPHVPTQTLRYLARVVTSGTYRWEPAVLQSSIIPEQGVVLPQFEVTIGGLGS